MALKGHDTKAPKVGKADSHPKSPDQSSLKSLLGKTFTSVSAMIGLLAGIAVFTAPFAKSGSALLKETLSCAAIIFLGASILITLTAYRKERLTIRAPVAAGTTILLLAIGIVGGVVIRQPGQPAKNPVGGIALASPVASASATTGSTTCAANLQITSPANGVHIIHKEGVDISVRACGLVNEYGWVFNYDDSDKYYHEDYIQHSGPNAV